MNDLWVGPSQVLQIYPKVVDCALVSVSDPNSLVSVFSGRFRNNEVLI